MGFVPGPSDPFYELMQPPPDETPAQATARQKRELDAQRINDRIDEEIKQERARAKKERNVIKLLLLGQSESDFRMRYAKEEWEEERSGWRSVVQLNIVRSITTIIRIVEAEMNGDAADSEEEQIIAMEERDQEENEGLKFTDRHQLLMIRLAPLLGVEAELKRRLGAGAAEPMQTAPMAATPFELPQQPNPRRKKAAEFSVRSWKDVLDKESRIQSSDAAATGVDLPTMTLAALKDDMKALWQDKTIQQALQRNKVQLSDSAGFFLNDLDRIATRDYVVTDNDIVRARLRTVGIQEHKLVFSHGGGHHGWEWRIFDVGGCRTLRAAWLPYFEGVNVIIFLSPVSVFDQWLEEDPRVNRLEDSIILWTSICQSKLLAKTQLILFLNKCDLLRRKLKRGVKVNQYLPSYGDKPNEVISVVKYLREKFKDIQKQCSPEHRSAYIYPTTVTDTEATAITLESVRDGVLRENLAASQLI
ncbi:heterotrimeric G protein alpha subunit [Coprinopsis cinerea okayama7|uniref:Heterotrimeric G protein alpha subunit n=1 Tax=Coprinopsis cinerea (strain Okayama-7 / 130 / ATCC MYA-4618 / FGSC 9003) TaxID=240176 RepID=A8P052_COPC7|nr:heterotrimeric G protein alpha subunit [Coprinopsis cinerea okayama7\|eukprot:XP_001837791.2 heterotrimeric G protein alpha subunit [Coprinopsis cinerea okayama7\